MVKLARHYIAIKIPLTTFIVFVEHYIIILKYLQTSSRERTSRHFCTK